MSMPYGFRMTTPRIPITVVPSRREGSLAFFTPGQRFLADARNDTDGEPPS